MPTLRRTRERLSEALTRRLGFTPAAQETPSAPLSISAPILPPKPVRETRDIIPLDLPAPQKTPNHASFEAPADPQDNSPLVSALPPEVRQLVYGYMWRTGGHLYGIHVLKPMPVGRTATGPCSVYPGYFEAGGRIVTGPCSLHPGYFGAAAEANAELDALLDGAGVGEGERMRGLSVGTGLKGERVRRLVDEMGRTHFECDDDGVHGLRNTARFRTGEGVDPPALWSPFLPVLLTCKRIYLESVGTIFRDLPPILDPHNPVAASALLYENPHPSIHNLQTITLSSEHFTPGPHTPNTLPLASNPATKRPTAAEGAARTWVHVFTALRHIPSLREIRLSLRLSPVHVIRNDADLRPLAKCAGPLAAKFVVSLMRDEDRDVDCRACGKPPRSFILPPENVAAGGGGGEAGTPAAGKPPPFSGTLQCPPFGQVVWHEAPRYAVVRDTFPPAEPFVRALSRDLCSLCNQRGSRHEGENPYSSIPPLPTD